MRSISILLAILVAALPFASSLAAECNEDTLAYARQLTAKYKEIERKLIKSQSRADSVSYLNSTLPKELQVDTSSREELPQLPNEYFKSARPILECDDEGNANVQLDQIMQILLGIEVDIDRFDQHTAELRKKVEDAKQLASGSGNSASDSNQFDAQDDSTASSGGSAPDDSGIRREPLTDPGNPNIYRRVISLPGGLVHPEDSDPYEHPVFTVFYVFGEESRDGESWLEVGFSLREKTLGWIKLDDTLDWSTMLVMQFAPVGQRQRTLFFEESENVIDLISSVQFAREAQSHYDNIFEERDKAANSPDYVPAWDPELVAIEPDAGLRFDQDPYLLPILDWKEGYFDDATETVLLKVAAVPADSRNIGARDDRTFRSSSSDLAEQGNPFRIGIAFVIDTTISMAPFIERTHETVQAFYDVFSRYESSSLVSFSVIGFRDNINVNDKIEYVTRIFHPLDIESEPIDVLNGMRRINESSYPTLDFREDVFAGIDTAISDLDWDPYGARLIILVTDASARTGNDPLASLPGISERSILDLARQYNIAIVPVHLQTPANQKNGDFERARAQYELFARTGDINNPKYISVNATDDSEFKIQLSNLANQIGIDLLRMSSGIILPEDEDLVPKGPEMQTVARAVSNEIFRAQLESLSEVGTDIAPSFLAGWAADRDLTDPELKMMSVSVFLTRNQLSTLGRKLDNIVDAFRNGGDDPTKFFQNLQLLAAETATDPEAPTPDSDNIMEAILPAFLQNLPYRSEILRINELYWGSLSVSQRQELVEQLEEKSNIYASIEENIDLWKDFGSGISGLETTLVPLDNLP
ncbi:MAG: VWA domain-containing protein [Albidovulum sp.]|nr:VWA domain-containing protein [Albidovulum sp.]MDE0533214.1 VWA domain-containing protein [Albidovulum sp.]